MPEWNGTLWSEGATLACGAEAGELNAAHPTVGVGRRETNRHAGTWPSAKNVTARSARSDPQASKNIKVRCHPKKNM